MTIFHYCGIIQDGFLLTTPEHGAFAAFNLNDDQIADILNCRILDCGR